MQKWHPLTGQCKGYGTQVTIKACTHLVLVFFIHNYHIYINIIVRSNSIQNSSVSIVFFIAIDKIGWLVWTDNLFFQISFSCMMYENILFACQMCMSHVSDFSYMCWLTENPFLIFYLVQCFTTGLLYWMPKKKKEINLQLRQDNKILKVQEEDRIYYTFGYQCFFLYKSSLNWFVTDFFLSAFWCFINYSSQ